MRFSDTLTMVIGLLVREKQLSYRFLKREFELDDTALEDLRFELIIVDRLALDRDGEFLVWAGAVPAADAATTFAAMADRAAVRPIARPEIAPLEIVQPPAEPHGADAERRPLTVMFCDLADSTALSTKLDPEDLQDVIRAYQERCTGIIRSTKALSPSTWATASWSISATPSPWSAMPSARSGAGSRSWKRWPR